ncbi:hypothetical protein NQ315_004999 [Exocentrus adspersus]|uniref:Uncharacterized protein n=1 Tax=Exocentrus adspersus TaxID=1586481 RepID=A0AAV8V7W8_9CUCU|nr:hypothetical protein NQ315_004999 [Exocentrus adspersus]
MVLDTGSSHTIVKPNFVVHCRNQNINEEYQLETASGEVIPVKRVHFAEIRLGNSTFKQKVFVADITDDVLLGLNVMAEQNFILDLPQRILKTNNKEIILNFPKIRALPTRTVKVVEDVKIPPQSEVVLEAICDDSIEEDETVIVEPKTESLLHYRGILTGRTLTVKKDHRMFVRIINLKDSPQQILKGEPIGICQTAEVVAMQKEVHKTSTDENITRALTRDNKEIETAAKPRRTYRSAVHESTGNTPASVVFGAELRLPIDLISDRPKKEEGVDNYISHLQDRLKLTHAEVRQKLKLESEDLILRLKTMKTRYDLRANTSGFQVGEKVWLYNTKRTKGKSPKLQKSWEGPSR